MRRVLFLLCLMVSTAFAQLPDLTGFLVDYKFWYIKRNDKGIITEAAIRFFAGKITTEDELGTDGQLHPVTRYRRQQRINEFPAQLQNLISTDSNGNVVVKLTPTQFGNISTDDQLRTFLNTKLAQVAVATNGTPIDQQK